MPKTNGNFVVISCLDPTNLCFFLSIIFQDLMNQLIKIPNESSVNQFFLKEFSKLLLNTNEISNSKILDISSCYLEYEKLLQSIDDHIQNITQSSQIMELRNRM